MAQIYESKQDETITFEELARALCSVRIWMKASRDSDTAQLMRVLNSRDAANDIFTSVMVAREKT